MTIPAWPTLALCAVLMATSAVAAPSQTPPGEPGVIVEGPVRGGALRVLQRVQARGDYLLLDRDTVLPAAFHTAGDLIVWDARVHLEGSVDGSAVAVQGTLLLRPGSRVGGTAAAVDGLVLASAHAEVGAVVELPPGTSVRVERDADRLRVRLVEAEVPRLGLGGLFGVRRLGYDRVDGLAVAWGPQWRLTGRERGPRADAWVTLRTTRRPGAGGQLWLPVGGPVELTVGAERATRTNEGWIRGVLPNTAGALLLGRDLRDYHAADALWARLGFSQPAAEDPGFRAAPYLALTRSRDASLEPRSRRALHGRRGLDRPNREVIEDVVYSAELGALLAWAGPSSSFAGRALLEHLRLDSAGTDHTRWLLDGRWDMEALWDHRLGVRWHGLGTFARRPAPPQRWSFVGGQGTLPTLPLARSAGDRLAFVESRYAVPLRFVDPPFFREPALELLHATGAAWLSGTPMPRWEQSLGAGLASSWLRARAWIDPADAGARPTVLIEFATPGGTTRGF